MSDIYCGIKKVPKGKKQGSMKECAERGQVMYWGLNKVDMRVLESTKVEKKMSLDKARLNKIKLDTRLKKLKKDLDNVPKKDKKETKEKKKTIKKQIEKTEKELVKATKEFKEAFKRSEEKKQKKNSKKATKKPTKKK